MTNFFLRCERFFEWLGRPLLRHGVFIVAMVVLAVTSAAIIGRPSTRHAFFALQFFIDTYALCWGLYLLPHKFGQVVKIFLYITTYLLTTIETFLFFRFNLSFSPTMLNLLLETNTGEASEFLSGCVQSQEFWKTLGIYGCILVCNIFAALWGYRSWYRVCKLLHVHENRHMRSVGYVLRFVLVPSLALVGLLVAGAPWMKEKVKMVSFLQNQHTRKAEQVPVHIFYTSFYRLLHSAHFLQIARNETQRLMDRMQVFRVDSCAATCPNIVVVIGESYNKHHSQLYGYQPETTPHLFRLAKRGSLQVFDNVVTPWNVTSQCFKSFLSTQSEDDEGTWADGVLFPCIFRQAGYKVAFVTNQFYMSAAQGIIDFNGSFFLNDERMDSLCFDFRNRFRSRSEAEITQQLSNYEPADLNLYMIHLYGQHMEYHQRYPYDHKYFTADDIARPDLNDRQRAIIAHYDNATRYNDEVVARIFSYFKQQDAIVLYFSDHGEEVYDGDIGIYGRNHTPTPDQRVLHSEYEIPFMMWATNSFQRQHPEVWKRVKEATHRPFSHDDLPHLLMGLAGISTQHYKPQRDLLSPEFKPQRRIIKNSVDYDKVMQQRHSAL